MGEEGEHVVIILKNNGFLTVNGDVFGLLGISGGSYVASKITQRATNQSGNVDAGGHDN